MKHLMNEVKQVAARIIGNVEKAIVGKRPQLVWSLVSWFCEGHILLEDVPGVAKTMLARALALSVRADFKRVQCTPDLLPTDVTGASRYLPGTRHPAPGPRGRSRAKRREGPRLLNARGIHSRRGGRGSVRENPPPRTPRYRFAAHKSLLTRQE